MAGYLSKDCKLYLGNKTVLADLTAGSGGHTLSCRSNTVEVSALGRDSVQREAVSVDHTASVASLFGASAFDHLVSLQGAKAQTLFWYHGVGGDALAGPVLCEELSVESPYDDIVTATGSLPSTDSWYVCSVAEWAFDDSDTTDTVAPPGTGFTRVWLVIDKWDSTLTPTLTLGGTAIGLSNVGMEHTDTTTASGGTLALTAMAGSGDISGYLVAGKAIGV